MLTERNRTAFATLLLILAVSTVLAEEPISATFSIVAVDPGTGICGAAVASKYPAVGRVVPYVRSGVGAFCTQHYHVPDWGEEALDRLAGGQSVAAVLEGLLTADPRRDQRQLALIDLEGRVALANPTKAPHDSQYWGAITGPHYSVQGNTLAGREVLASMATAYEETAGTLADKLIASLVAGDCAGGDKRGRLAAGIRVCRPHQPGYWLELYVDRSDDAVRELARRYGDLRHEGQSRAFTERLRSEPLCPDEN